MFLHINPVRATLGNVLCDPVAARVECHILCIPGARGPLVRLELGSGRDVLRNCLALLHGDGSSPCRSAWCRGSMSMSKVLTWWLVDVSARPCHSIAVAISNVLHVHVLFMRPLLKVVLVRLLSIKAKDCEETAHKESRTQDDEEDDKWRSECEAAVVSLLNSHHAPLMDIHCLWRIR